MAEITLDHVKQAAEWAKDARGAAVPLDGLVRKYDQSTWDCGTACCMWGGASIKAGNGPASQGPPSEWSGQSTLHVLVAGLLRSGCSTPEQMLDLLTRANLTRANLTRADLTRADLTDADLTSANLTRANLTSANLTRADLTRADLTDANLTSANLTRADLTDANLTRADLTSADLTDADLTDAYIRLGNRIAKLQ